MASHENHDRFCILMGTERSESFPKLTSSKRKKDLKEHHFDRTGVEGLIHLVGRISPVYEDKVFRMSGYRVQLKFFAEKELEKFGSSKFLFKIDVAGQEVDFQTDGLKGYLFTEDLPVNEDNAEQIFNTIQEGVPEGLRQDLLIYSENSELPSGEENIYNFYAFSKGQPVPLKNGQIDDEKGEEIELT